MDMRPQTDGSIIEGQVAKMTALSGISLIAPNLRPDTCPRSHAVHHCIASEYDGMDYGSG